MTLSTFALASRIHAAAPESDWRTHPDGSTMLTAADRHIAFGEEHDEDGELLGINVTYWDDDEVATTDWVPVDRPAIADRLVDAAADWLRA